MLKNLFKGYDTQVDIQTGHDGTISISLRDYLPDNRKQQIYVNEPLIARELERFWETIKRSSSKLNSVNIRFEELDWYDNMTDIYKVPNFKVERGKRKVRVGHYETGSIPKEWDTRITGVFKPGRVKKPYMEFVNSILYISPAKKAEVEKELGKVLSGKEKWGSVYVYNN
jgi:hypothetical protein